MRSLYFYKGRKLISHYYTIHIKFKACRQCLGSDSNISTTIEYIALKICTDIQVPLRMNATDDPLTFH